MATDSHSRSRDALLSFIQSQADDGLVPIATAQSRYASVRKVLSILDGEAAADVTAIDVDRVMRDFLRESDHKYSIASQVSYKSRLQSSIDEFCAFLNGGAGVSRRYGKSRISTAELAVREAKSARQEFTFGLRPGVLVRVEGLPIDLTVAEAHRLANVLLAYAPSDIEP